MIFSDPSFSFLCAVIQGRVSTRLFKSGLLIGYITFPSVLYFFLCCFHYTWVYGESLKGTLSSSCVWISALLQCAGKRNRTESRCSAHQKRVSACSLCINQTDGSSNVLGDWRPLWQSITQWFIGIDNRFLRHRSGYPTRAEAQSTIEAMNFPVSRLVTDTVIQSRNSSCIFFSELDFIGDKKMCYYSVIQLSLNSSTPFEFFFPITGCWEFSFLSFSSKYCNYFFKFACPHFHCCRGPGRQLEDVFSI